MFSQNQKISKRQITRLLIFDMTGISTLLLPSLLAQIAGRDGIFCIFAGVLPAYLVILLMQKLQQKVEISYPYYLKQRLGKWVGGILLAVYFVYGVLLAGYTLYVVSGLVQTALLREESYWLIGICMLLLGGYGIMGGIEGRARIYELLFWILMLPLILMLLLAVPDVSVDYWTPVVMTGGNDFLRGTLLVFLFYLILCFVLFLQPFETKKEEGIAAAKRALGITALLNAAVYLIVLGVFGTQTLAVMRYPVVTLMSMIKLPGGFFERQDAFMVAIWFFTLYALLNSSMFYAAEVGKQIVGQNRQRGCLVVTLLLTFAAAAFFYRSAAIRNLGRGWLIYTVIPFLVLLPLLLLIGKRKEKGENGE